MAILLNQEQVNELLTMNDCIEVIERAFADYAAGKYDIPQRIKLHGPGNAGAGYFMPGSSNAKDPSFGMKIVTEFPANKNLNLPSVSGLIILLDTATGRPLAIMDGGYITNVRTAAASAVAAKHLARKDAETVGLIGLGEQGLIQLVAMSQVRHLKSIRVCSPSAPLRKTKLN